MRGRTAAAYRIAILLPVIVVGFLSSTAASAEQKMPVSQQQMTPPVAQPGAKVSSQRPDLIISAISFEVVQNTTWGAGKPCQIYNLFATVKNQRQGDANAFNVLIERNKGANGTFGVACQTCIVPVAGLERDQA